MIIKNNRKSSLGIASNRDAPSMQGSVATPTKFNMHNFMKDKGFKDEHAKFFN